MEGTALGAVLLVYMGGILAPWLSPLYFRQAAEREAVRRMALLWPGALVSIVILLGAALVCSLSSHRNCGL